MKNKQDSKTPVIGVRRRFQQDFSKGGRTKQAFRDECNINNVVNRYQQTGVLPVTNSLEPQYGDAPNLDLKESLDLVYAAREEFNNLTNEQKQAFNNDENLYFEYLANPEKFSSEFVENFGSGTDQKEFEESTPKAAKKDDKKSSEKRINGGLMPFCYSLT